MNFLITYIYITFLLFNENTYALDDSSVVLSELEQLKDLIEKRSTTRHCMKLNFDEKMLQYKAQSGYDSIYVASTAKEAILFPNLLWDINKRKQYVKLIDQLAVWYNHVKNHKDPSQILRLKNLVASKLNATLAEVTGLHQNHLNVTKRKVLPTVRVSVPITNCTNPGDVDPITGMLNLCEQCAVTTTLPEDRFPRYVNEVTCGAKKVKTCFKGEGLCKQNMRLMNFLRKSNTCNRVPHNGSMVWVEKWELVREPIRVSCECQMGKNSSLVSLV